MAKRRSPAEYAAMVKTLRHFASGFDAQSGYNLHNAKEFTPSQKGQITRYFAEVDKLRARPYYLYRGRREDHLRRAQEMAQHDPHFKKLKVAFVPFYEPSRGGKESKSRKITFNKESIKTDAGYYKRTFVPFDAMALAKRAAEEIQKAMDKVPGSDVFAIKAGKFDMPNAFNRGELVKRVIQLMQRYDGVTPLPRAYRSRRAMKGDADNPALHHWSRWLLGVIAYEFKGKPDPVRLLRDAAKAKENLRKMRAQARRKRRK